MDNDVLINQARALYAALQVKQQCEALPDKDQDRLGALIVRALCRYHRRLNHCVLCYRYRTKDCERERAKNCNLELWQMGCDSDDCDFGRMSIDPTASATQRDRQNVG